MRNAEEETMQDQRYKREAKIHLPGFLRKLPLAASLFSRLRMVSMRRPQRPQGPLDVGYGQMLHRSQPFNYCRQGISGIPKGIAGA